MEVRLQGSADWAELWSGLTASAGPLELETIYLDVNAPAVYEGYHARWDRRRREGEPSAAWRLVVPLLVRGQPIGRLEIAGDRSTEPLGDKMIAVCRWIEEVEQAVVILVAFQTGDRDEKAVPPPPAQNLFGDRLAK